MGSHLAKIEKLWSFIEDQMKDEKYFFNNKNLGIKVIIWALELENCWLTEFPLTQNSLPKNG